MRFVIIGAGISGLACADRLRAAGIDSMLFEKARGAGGRMSTRRVETPAGTVHMDHGAQYFTVRDPLFGDQVASWAERGVVARWPEVGSDAWVGSPTMNAPIRHMAADHDVRFAHHAHGLVRKDGKWWVRFDSALEGPFDGAVIALPAEQAAPILGLHDLGMARVAMAARSQPCWTAMIVFGAPLAIPVNHVRESGIIAWAARNGAKPSREGPEAWIVHGSGSWSAAHLEDSADSVAQGLLAALAARNDGAALPPVLSLAAHRWRFAMTRGTDDVALWNEALGLGACGDWLYGPRVEQAWLSGEKLGGLISKSQPI